MGSPCCCTSGQVVFDSAIVNVHDATVTIFRGAVHTKDHELPFSNPRWDPHCICPHILALFQMRAVRCSPYDLGVIFCDLRTWVCDACVLCVCACIVCVCVSSSPAFAAPIGTEQMCLMSHRAGAWICPPFCGSKYSAALLHKPVATANNIASYLERVCVCACPCACSRVCLHVRVRVTLLTAVARSSVANPAQFAIDRRQQRPSPIAFTA